MFFLWTIILLILLSILIITLSFKIEIENLEFIFPKTNQKSINNKCRVRLKIYVLKKIKIIDIDLKKINLKDEKFKNRIQKLEDRFEQNSLKLNFNISELLRNIDAQFEKMSLKIFVGIEDAAITAIFVGIISSAIGIFLRNKIEDTEVQKYQVIPVYQNINILKINFDGIFEFKMRNIIYIFKLLKKRSVEKNGRTSNRRSYAYGNE